MVALTSSPSSLRQAYAASDWRNSWASVICSERNSDPMISPTPPYSVSPDTSGIFSQLVYQFISTLQTQLLAKNCPDFCTFSTQSLSSDFARSHVLSNLAQEIISINSNLTNYAGKKEMFSCKDLEGYVCSSSSALELKFGEQAAGAVKSAWAKYHVHTSLLTSVHRLFKFSVALFPLLVRKEADVSDGSLAFSPQFTHQVFGEKWGHKSPHASIKWLNYLIVFWFCRETIFGYKNLKIKVCCSCTHHNLCNSLN